MSSVHERPLEELLRQVDSQLERYGLEASLTKEIHNKLKKQEKELRQAQHRIDVLECLALESSDQNIADLRQQLFLAVSMVHGEDIEKYVQAKAAEEGNTIKTAILNSKNQISINQKSAIYNTIAWHQLTVGQSRQSTIYQALPKKAMNSNMKSSAPLEGLPVKTRVKIFKSLIRKKIDKIKEFLFERNTKEE